MNNSNFSFTIPSILALTILASFFSVVSSSQPEVVTSPPPITILIRGTSRSTNMARIIPFLTSLIPNKFLTPEGFLPITSLRQTSRFYALAQGLSQADPVNFPFEHIFFFGWSGKASRRARRAAAQRLCHHIKKLKQNPLYKNSPVRVITHSHGGNLALSVALHCKSENTCLIDQLILLACPAQDATEKYLNSHAFKQVISIYSTGDLVQIIDPQGIYNRLAETFFSRRTFKPVHNKLIQVCVTNRNKGLGHMAFVGSWFGQYLPQIITQATQSLSQNQHSIMVDICKPTKKKLKKRKGKAKNAITSANIPFYSINL